MAAICMSIAAGIALYSLVQYSAPQLTSRAYRSDAMVAPAYGGVVQVDPALATVRGGPQMLPPPPPPTPRQMREARERAARWAIDNERSSGVRGMLLWGIVLGVSGVLWMLHWRILRQQRATAG